MSKPKNGASNGVQAQAQTAQVTGVSQEQGEDGEDGVTVTVPMIRDTDLYPAPHTADVHPDEVDNFLAGGWVEAPKE